MRSSKGVRTECKLYLKACFLEDSIINYVRHTNHKAFPLFLQRSLSLMLFTICLRIF